jgi:type I restriction enzyme S subunit
MNTEQLLAHYERIADAPDAVPRLRQFILDLAVRGKLVPQNASDEPAAELLKRIAAEKARLVQAGEIKKENPVKAVSPSEAPFILPEGWTWTSIGEICSKTGSGSTPRGGKDAYCDTGIVFLRSQNIYDSGLQLNDVVYIDAETHARMSGTAVQPLDLLLNITGGSIGRCCRVPDDFKEANVSQHVAIIRVAVNGLHDFLHQLILSPYFQSFIFDEQTGAGRGGLPKNRMDRIPVALPPLAEQRRIVARVDELMALCDQLAAARQQRETTRDRLAAASLARLNQPDPDPPTFRAHAAFALDNLAALTTRPDQVTALRQTILNLAVRGKLVPQDASDEPAAELLKRIAAEKARIVEEGKFKSLDTAISLDRLIPPFLIPETWIWCYLDDIAAIARGGSPRPIKSYLTDDPDGLPWIKIGDSVRGSIYINDAKEKIRPEGLSKTRMVFPGDLILSNSMSFGYPYITNIQGCIHDGWLLIRIPDELVNKLFVYNIFLSPYSRGRFTYAASGAVVQNLNADKVRQLPIPLPPLAEQRRIVARVDALMALCDRLEASLSGSEHTRRRLLDALLHAALAPAEGAVAGVNGDSTEKED